MLPNPIKFIEFGAMDATKPYKCIGFGASLGLSGALQKILIFYPGPGASGGPRKVPLGHPWAFPGPPEASRRPPGPKTNQSKKPRYLKELTERWSQLVVVGCDPGPEPRVQP